MVKFLQNDFSLGKERLERQVSLDRSPATVRNKQNSNRDLQRKDVISMRLVCQYQRSD